MLHESMKFAHMSDCHIGSWQRHAKLTDASITAFSKAIDVCIEERVDFILISGDLFDTSIPAVDKLKEAVFKLKQLKDRGIPVYVIAGSHDFSPSGKTMLDVLENAGLFTNVSKPYVDDEKLKLEFTTDEKTGAKITGLYGKKGGLEKNQYANLHKVDLESESGFKIFMLHSGIDEYKPKHLEQMEAVPLGCFPKGFNYYAAGHIHHVFSKEEPQYGLIAFPGPLFPNSFDELERLNTGGFYIVEAGNVLKLKYVPVKVYDFLQLKLDCNGKTPSEVESSLFSFADENDISGKIVGIRLFGTLSHGKTSDINFRGIIDDFCGRGAHCVLENTYSLSSEFFKEIKASLGTVENVEDSIVSESAGKLIEKDREVELIKSLIASLSLEKDEGERQADFESRVIDQVQSVLKAHNLL